MLLALMIATFVFRVIGPDLLAFTVLQIVLPLAFVAGTVLVHVDAPAIRLIVEPLSLEDITVDVPEFAVTTGLVKTPVALVLGTVFPDLHAVAVLHIAEPVTSIGGAILKVDLSTLLKLRLIDILHVKVGILLILKTIIAAGIVLVVRVQLLHLQLSTNPLSGDYASGPGLHTDNNPHVTLEESLIKKSG